MTFKHFVLFLSLFSVLLFFVGCSELPELNNDSDLLGSTDISTSEKSEISENTSQSDVTSNLVNESISKSSTTNSFVDENPNEVNSDKNGIPFVMGTNIRIYNKGTDSFFGQIVKDKSALDNLKLDNNYSVSKYSNDYFHENALLNLHITLESGSMQIRIDAIVIKEDVLEIQYTTICPEEFTTDMAYWHILVEVNKDYVKNISEITGARNRVEKTRIY